MSGIYIAETVVIFAGAAYFFAAPRTWHPWLGFIPFTVGIVAMILTKVFE